jgi:hypothetical protein
MVLCFMHAILKHSSCVLFHYERENHYSVDIEQHLNTTRELLTPLYCVLH